MKYFYYNVLVTMLLLFLGSILCAENIKGTVFSGDKPLEGVVVTDGYTLVLTQKNGEFSFDVAPDARFVYLSVPSGYMAPVEEGVVKFYIPLEENRHSYDFDLIRKRRSDIDHGFVVVADPQIYASKEFSLLKEGVDDIKESIEQFDIPFHGIAAGDLISHDHTLYPQYNSIMSQAGIPFFNVMGNHDMVVYGRSHETSFNSYEQMYGPHYYSFNVGNVHYIMLNDNFFIGRDYFYIGYLTENQLKWMERDLSYVPEGSTVVVTIHIPSTLSMNDRKSFSYEKAGVTMSNHKALHTLLDSYKAHIISGHTHTNHNVLIKDNLYEHVTAALSGAWWQGGLCTDGTPKGYGVYIVKGDSLEWYYKSTGIPSDHQMRVYTEKDDASFKGYVVANVWNWDPSWRVELYEDGLFSSVMERFETYDPLARDIYSDKEKLEHKWIWPSLSDKFFRAAPKSMDSQLEVVATDRFGHQYRETLSDRYHYQVVIIGGGTSGTAAGIKAASMGVNTLIVEENEWLGGMLTSAGVSATDGNYKLRGGLWDTFRDSLESYYGGADALNTGWVSNILFEPSVGARIFKNIASKYPKLNIWFDSYAEKPVKRENGWSLNVCKGGDSIEIFAEVLIDATELGDIAAEAGVEYDLGMDSKYDTGENIAPEEKNGIVQDLTYAMILKEYDKDMTIEMPDGYNPELFYCSTISDKCVNPKEKHRLWSPEMMITYGKLPGNKYMINWPIEGNDYYINIVEESREQREQMLKKAKNHSLSFLYYIQTELGYNHLGLADDEFPTDDLLPFIPYHRESRRIKGIVRFTTDNIKDPYAGGSRLYRTAVAVGDYPVDHHHTRYEGWESLPDLHFYPVPSYGLPLGTVIPEKQDDLIVAEKSISVTNLVNGTTRLQPVVLQIGEVAGVLAALSVKQEIKVRDVSVRDVQERILEDGGYLLPYLDLSVEHPHFKILQRIGVTGILRGVGKNEGWENQTWFYIDSLVRKGVLLENTMDFYGHVFETDILGLNPEQYVTAQYLAVLFSAIVKDFGKDYFLEEFSENWDLLGLDNYDPERALSKLECAVLFDYFLDPFYTFDVDFIGNVTQ